MGYTKEDGYIAISNAIETNKKGVVDALRKSGISVSPAVTKVTLVHLVANNIFKNPSLSQNLKKVVAEEFSNVSAGVVGSVSDAIAGLFGMGQQAIANAGAKKDAERQLEIEKERARAEMMKNLTQKKTDYLPFMIIGGVLLLGGTVVILTLKK